MAESEKIMYTFKKSQEPESVMYYSSKICNVYYPFSADFNENMARFPGQLKFLFGEPLYINEDFENMLEYIIEATDESGNTLLLSVYCAGSGPAIGGHAKDNEAEYEKAAEELAAYIRQADTVDYEYKGYYLDGPCTIKMGVKNGKPYYEEKEMSEKEVMKLYEKFN